MASAECLICRIQASLPMAGTYLKLNGRKLLMSCFQIIITLETKISNNIGTYLIYSKYVLGKFLDIVYIWRARVHFLKWQKNPPFYSIIKFLQIRTICNLLILRNISLGPHRHFFRFMWSKLCGMYTKYIKFEYWFSRMYFHRESVNTFFASGERFFRNLFFQ